ncbi:MAG: glycosyltransferase [Pyrinomonadaceae bacterium]
MAPRVSVVITAYNEDRDLAAKLENTLSLDYPEHLLEIIVASDCSTDRTMRSRAVFLRAACGYIAKRRGSGKRRRRMPLLNWLAAKSFCFPMRRRFTGPTCCA